jgi:hypothetical protein
MEGRRELKHIIGYAEALSLRNRLRHVLRSDEHAGPDGTYRIRSLYFDNYQDKVLREKLDGIAERDKFRLRVYGESFDTIRLEKKSKRNGLGWKRSTWLTRTECLDLLDGRKDWMKDRDDPLLQEFRHLCDSQLLRPSTIVDYRREAYTYPSGNVRITIDSDLRTGLRSRDFLNPALPLIPTEAPGTCILEVKFDGFLPDFISALVQLGDRQSTAVSKFAICRTRG